MTLFLVPWLLRGSLTRWLMTCGGIAVVAHVALTWCRPPWNFCDCVLSLHDHYHYHDHPRLTLAMDEFVGLTMNAGNAHSIFATEMEKEMLQTFKIEAGYLLELKQGEEALHRQGKGGSKTSDKDQEVAQVIFSRPPSTFVAALTRCPLPPPLLETS